MHNLDKQKTYACLENVISHFMDRQLITILFSLTLCSCNNSDKDKYASTQTSIDTLAIIKTFPLVSDTADIQGTNYIACSNENQKLYVTNSSGDTVYKHFDLCNGAEFTDFDNDKNKDILFHYLTNVPDIYDLALFDAKSKTFKLVEKFNSFPAPVNIINTKYYYSYRRSGFADSNWDSDLFYISNFKAYCIGNIAGRDCDDVIADVGIFISKIASDKIIPCDTFEIETISKYKDDKWGFIADYWTNNYKKFTGREKNGL